MRKLLRIAAGLALLAGLLDLANLAVHDCTTGLGVYDNCVWVWVREHSGLPSSKLLRALTLEVVGLALLAGLYITLRYVFPWKAEGRRPPADGSRGRPSRESGSKSRVSSSGLMENPSIAAIERRILQALAQGTPQGSIREAAREFLRGYRWREPLHEAIYEAMLSVPSESPETIRLDLPARLTRRGFPDFDLEMCFTPHGLSKAGAERLIERLRALAG